MKKFITAVFFVMLFSSNLYAAENVKAYTTLEAPLAKALFDQFEADTGINVEWERLSGGEAIMRLIDESEDQKASIWVGGVGTQHIEAKNRGLSVSYRSPAAKNIPFHYRDHDAYWTGLYIGPLSFCVNFELMKKMNLPMPHSWSDLTLPVYKNSIRVAHPYTSGTAYNMLTTIIRLCDSDEDMAFEYFKTLDNSIERYTRSGSAPAKSCAAGEIPIAIGYLHDQVKLQKEGAKIDIIIPSDGTGFETASMSILKSSSDLTNAYKLYDWILGSKATAIISKWYVIPLSKLAVASDTGFSLVDMKLVNQDDQWDADNKIRLLRRWEKDISSVPEK